MLANRQLIELAWEGMSLAMAGARACTILCCVFRFCGAVLYHLANGPPVLWFSGCYCWLRFFQIVSVIGKHYAILHVCFPLTSVLGSQHYFVGGQNFDDLRWLRRLSPWGAPPQTPYHGGLCTRLDLPRGSCGSS